MRYTTRDGRENELERCGMSGCGFPFSLSYVITVNFERLRWLAAVARSRRSAGPITPP